MNRWANYNGPGKPLTDKQLEELLLKECGIKARIDENGKGYYLRSDFEAAWERLGIGDGD